MAEAEEQAARAEARAQAARTRAMRLRHQAEAASSEAEPPLPGSARPHRWLRRPRRKAVAVGAAIVLICASLGASGYMASRHRTAVHERQRAAEFAQAARQGIITLMSIDANHAKDDVQRIIDDSTGRFKDAMQMASLNLAAGVEQMKISSRVTVDAVAVESMTDDSAVVLVAAKSDINDPKTKRPPRSWRLSVDLNRVGGQLKMSKVEFIQ